MLIPHQSTLTKVSTLIEELKERNKKDVGKYKVKLEEHKPIFGNVLGGNYTARAPMVNSGPYYATVTYSKDKPLLARYYMNDKEYALAHELLLRHELDEVKNIKRILAEHNVVIPKERPKGLIDGLKHEYKVTKDLLGAIGPERIYSHISPAVLLEESKNVAHKEVPKNVKDYFRTLRILTGERSYMRGYGHEMYSEEKVDTNKIIKKRRSKGHFGDANLIYGFPFTLPETALEMIRAKRNGPDYIRASKRGM